MSIELISKDACGIEIERKGNRIDILLVENEPVDQQVIVRAVERIEFLTPWINMLIHHKEEAGLKGKEVEIQNCAKTPFSTEKAFLSFRILYPTSHRQQGRLKQLTKKWKIFRLPHTADSATFGER